MNWAKEQLLRVLGTEIRRSWGSIRALEEELDLSPGYLSRIITGKRDISLDRFFRCLGHLPVSVERFFDRALQLDADHFLAALPYRSRVPRAITQLRRIGRGLTSMPHIDHPASVVDTGELLQRLARRSRLHAKTRFLRAEGAWRRPESIDRLLSYLQTLRLGQPHDAAQLARVAAVEIIPFLELHRRTELFGRAVGSFAAAHCLARQPETAARACRLGLEAVDRFRLGDKLRADLLRQTSRILGDYRCFHEALEVSTEASAIHARQRSLAELGKTYVDQGRLLLCQGVPGLAESIFRTALKCLPKHAVMSRFAAFHGTAAVSYQQGRHQDALATLDRAEACLDGGPEQERAHVHQLRGHIALATGRAEDACDYFEDACAGLRSFHPLDLALATFDLMQANLAAKRPAKARRLARSTAELLRPLRAHPGAESAVTDFLQALASEELSLSLIEKARKKIRRAGPGTAMPP